MMCDISEYLLLGTQVKRFSAKVDVFFIETWMEYQCKEIIKIVQLKEFKEVSFIQGYKPPNQGPSEYQTIPLNKIEDFGAYASQ